MEKKPSNFSATLYNLLGRLEMILLAILMVAIVLKQMSKPIDILLAISLQGLAVVFFLFAFRPPEIPSSEGKQMNFFDMVYYTTLPKLSWIACAVLTIGIFFTIMNLPGSRNMLQIGTAVGAFALITFGLGFFRSNERPQSLIDLLYRLVPLTGFGVYFLAL